MNILKRIRKSYITKGVAMLMAISMVSEFVWPTAAMALTSGPSQPETMSFEPVETTDMVNLFTGDFTYNIPLMNVPGPNGGYPINLAYHASPGMDEEASWVGLGWNINAGAINRQVRGLPDDFDGDEIITNTDMKQNWTVGLGVSPCLEIFGKDACNNGDKTVLNLGLNFRYNSYRGFGYSLNPSLALNGNKFGYSTGLSLDSDDGIGANASIRIRKSDKTGSDKKVYEVSNYLGAGFNSRHGLDISSSRSVQRRYRHLIENYSIMTNGKTTFRATPKITEDVDFNVTDYQTMHGSAFNGNIRTSLQKGTIIDFLGSSTRASSGISFAQSSLYPSTSMPINSYRLNVNIGVGKNFLAVFNKGRYSGNLDIQDLRHKGDDVAHSGYGYEHMYDDSQEKYVYNDFSRTKQGDVRKTSSNLAIPQLTHDVYGIQGQGIGGSFRPYRNEIGRIYDPHQTSSIGGGYFNLDGFGKKAGWGTGGTIGYSEQQAWDNHHELDQLAFSQPRLLWQQQGIGAPNFQKKEAVIYKVSGEKATLDEEELNHIGGEAPIGGEISGTGTVWNYGVKLPQNEDDPNVLHDITNERDVNERIARNNLVHKVTNEEILSFHPNIDELRKGYTTSNQGNSFLGEYEIFHYNWDSDAGGINQQADPDIYFKRQYRGGSSIRHHNGGYKVLDNSGSYFVYGLPVYNNKQVEKVFTVNSTRTVDPTILSPTDNLYDNDNPTHVSDYNDATKIFDNDHAIIPFETETNDGIEDVVYDHNNTQKYYNKKETPAYATSYLLTSILGADYIDEDGNGPDEGDKGYWVKMDYVKYTGASKWRAPYKGAIYSAGSAATLEDDVASYQYGEKELWYLSRIETETHIAIFELVEDRSDNFEAINEFANVDASVNAEEMKSGLRLSKIRLYEKEEYFGNPEDPTPIQTVHFTQTHRLCKNADNHSDNRGKLTLTGVHMTYAGNTRGAMNPYTFHYSDDLPGYNPEYSFEKYDRWGNYKGEPSTNLGLATNEINQELPYTGQYQQGAWGYEPDGSIIPLNNSNQSEFQEQKDKNVSVWSLSKIDLPSGGTITVNYEADDYAYLQNHRATQMSYITGVNDNTDSRNELYRWKGSDTENDFRDPTQRRIYFKLEHPISATAGYTEEDLGNMIYEDYVEDIRQDENGIRNLYFKSYMQLKDDAWDYVSGYVPLELNEEHTWTDRDGNPGTPAYTYGATTPVSIDGAGDFYTEGFVTIKRSHKKNDPTKAVFEDFHPIALAAWQYIRINASQIMADAGEFGTDEIANTDKGKAKKVKNLFSFLPELAKMFTGYRKYCFNREMARFILLDKSMIRLTSPDRKKFGGGSRVKQIAMSDNWDSFEDSELSESYGVVYDYTTTDPISGEQYSSGVAQYEPMIGGDEIAMRYPKNYPGKIPFFTDNNLFFEHPVNESYMPAPIVGYSKVTVRSLNTHNQMNNADAGVLSDEEKGRGVTGAKVYEFYTAKDYPVIVGETTMGTENKSIKSFNVPIIIPFIAEYRRNKIAATQGYKIELNDMHGQLKSTAKYGLDQNFNLLEEPISKTSYLYRDKEIVLDHMGKEIKVARLLDNDVPVISKDPLTGEFLEENKYVGVEYDFFTDQRHNKHAVLSFGLDFNLDIVMIPYIGPITFPSVWGHLNSSKNDVRTFTTNKIIRKSGILEKVVNENESYKTSVSTLKYDAISGRPLLTKTVNEFDDEVYNLSHPAYWEYDGMGHAYQNINLEFFAELDRISSQELFGGSVPSEIVDDLEPGDEFIARIRPAGSDNDYQNFNATFISKNYGGGSTDVIIHVDNATYVEEGAGVSDYNDGLEGYFKVYRSGHRNHFMTDAGTITSMVNPIDSDNITTTPKTYHAITGKEVLPSSATITIDEKFLNQKVLSANAITFKDNWEMEKGSNENPYRIGQAGIWRTVKTYVYAGDRTQTLAEGEKSPSTQHDGMMNNVPFFNWQISDYERFQKDWQWSGEVTRLNKFGYETENKDRLGIYSAALYGYNNAFPIGVGGNATYAEIAAQDFEMFNIGDGNSATGEITVNIESETNFFFHTEATASGTKDIYHSDKHKIVGGKVGIDNYIYLEGEYDATYWSGVTEVDLAVQSSHNSNQQEFRVLRANVISANSVTVPGCASCYTKVIVEFEHETISPSESAVYMPNASHLGGMATVYRPITVDLMNSEGTTSISINEEAHTGKQSLKIDGGYAGFVHGKLELIPGKRYVLSYWAKRNTSNVFDYNIGDSALEIYVAGTGTDLILPSETKTSSVINGWQKIDVEFEIDPTIYSDNQTIETRFDPEGSELYIDDIRISPKTGGIMTYVYNPTNYRLVATLNGNNYATFYYYGDQGNLYLTKQETEEGIISSGGSRGYSRSSTPE